MLFACQLNSVRSPIAAALLGQMFGKSIRTGSAGVQQGELDPFAVAVMDEAGFEFRATSPGPSKRSRTSKTGSITT